MRRQPKLTGKSWWTNKLHGSLAHVSVDSTLFCVCSSNWLTTAVVAVCLVQPETPIFVVVFIQALSKARSHRTKFHWNNLQLPNTAVNMSKKGDSMSKEDKEKISVQMAAASEGLISATQAMKQPKCKLWTGRTHQSTRGRTEKPRVLLLSPNNHEHCQNIHSYIHATATNNCQHTEWSWWCVGVITLRAAHEFFRRKHNHCCNIGCQSTEACPSCSRQFKHCKETTSNFQSTVMMLTK